MPPKMSGNAPPKLFVKHPVSNDYRIIYTLILGGVSPNAHQNMKWMVSWNSLFQITIDFHTAHWIDSWYLSVVVIYEKKIFNVHVLRSIHPGIFTAWYGRYPMYCVTPFIPHYAPPKILETELRQGVHIGKVRQRDNAILYVQHNVI